MAGIETYIQQKQNEVDLSSFVYSSQNIYLKNQTIIAFEILLRKEVNINELLLGKDFLKNRTEYISSR